jgi:hypothetical protein
VVIYPIISLFLIAYCVLPVLSLFSSKFIVATLDPTFLCYLLLITVMLMLLCLLEVKSSDIGFEEWWCNEQFWVIGDTSAHLATVLQGLLKVTAGITISFMLTAKASTSWRDITLAPDAMFGNALVS